MPNIKICQICNICKMVAYMRIWQYNTSIKNLGPAETPNVAGVSVVSTSPNLTHQHGLS